MYVGADGRMNSSFPLTKTDWVLQRELRFRRCSSTNKLIWPLQEAYMQVTAYGESNSESTTWVMQTEWLTPASYTYKKLIGTL